MPTLDPMDVSKIWKEGKKKKIWIFVHWGANTYPGIDQRADIKRKMKQGDNNAREKSAWAEAAVA